jgi:type IV pilus assembly protein PilB
MARKRIGEILVGAGILDETRLRSALVEQQRWGGPLGRILIEMKLVDESTLVEALSRQLSVPAVALDELTVPPEVLALVPGEMCEQYSIVPFAQPMKFLDVAMADPTQAGVIDELQIRTRFNVRPHIAGPKQIERAIYRFYHRGISSATFRRGGAASTAPPYTGGVRASIELDRGGGGDGEKMEIVRSILPEGEGTGVPSQPGRDAEIAALQQRVSRLEALVARDENVLRKVLSLLVDKGIATREEILERLK